MRTIQFAVSMVPAGFALVRRFGRAALMSDARGRWLLSGGRPSDRGEAREWISLFCHEALVTTMESGIDTVTPRDGVQRKIRICPSADSVLATSTQQG